MNRDLRMTNKLKCSVFIFNAFLGYTIYIHRPLCFKHPLVHAVIQSAVIKQQCNAKHYADTGHEL